MTITNKITTLYLASGIPDDSVVQAHIDSNNSDGYYLVSVDRIGSWYRFFWAKETA